MAFFERGETRIYYEEDGTGYPLLLIAPGGMNSAIASWRLAAFDPVRAYANDFRVIAMDQRNCGASTGPLDVNDPWGAFAEDQLGLLDHLGIDKFFVLGCCIGCSYLLSLAQRAPDRVTAGVLEQPIGAVPENEGRMLNGCLSWGKELVEKRSDIDSRTAEAFAQKMWTGDFVFSVSRDFVRSCKTPMLVMPGNDLAHPTPIGLEVAELAPKAELVERWKEPEVVPQTIERVRAFLKAHEAPVAAGV
ncbi:MAG TPA: alpha/beta hydrolase [Dehalococcoidia bacterium]|nr:alpha/beta hydrolase [Dehalococcoidia bacterium]